MAQRLQILGVPVDALTMEGAVEKAREIGRGDVAHTILAVNPEKVIKAREDAGLKQALDDAGILIPDGIGVVLAARLLYGQRFSRVAGADLCPQLCAMAAEEGWGVFLFGAKEEVNAEAAAELKRRYPSLNVAGRRNGYVSADEMPALVEEIRQSQAVIVFLALGSPRQELWMAEHLEACGARLCQGVGGTFDVLAGHVERAPALWRRLNLEWLYRLLSNPRRLLRQTALPRFAGLVLWNKLSGRR